MTSCAVATLKCSDRVNSPQGRDRLQETLNQCAELYNACLYQYRLAERDNPREFNWVTQQRQLTEVRARLTDYKAVHRRIQEAVINLAHRNWQRYIKAKSKGEKGS